MAGAQWGWNTGGTFGTLAPQAMNNNERFSVHRHGDGYGIWDIQSGGFVGAFPHEHQAKNFAQWQNYVNSIMPRE